jgi:hypothetical protein
MQTAVTSISALGVCIAQLGDAVATHPQVFDIMTLTLFLMALDCEYFSRPPEVIGYNSEFPDVCEWLICLKSLSCLDSFPFNSRLQNSAVLMVADCWSMPHIAHAFVGAGAIAVFAVLAGAFSMGEMEVSLG